MQQQPGTPVDLHVPNSALIRARGGFIYPRWWIISAFSLSLVLIILLCFGPFFPCVAAGNLCHFTSWHPLLQVSLIWLVFITIRFIAFIFGLGNIEVVRKKYTGTARFFRALSDFGPLHPLLMIYGIIAVGLLCVMWMLDRTTPLAFAMISISAFVANTSLLHRRSDPERRYYWIGYGVLALIALVFTLLYRLQSQSATPFILAEVLLIAGGVRAIFWHPRAAHPLTAQEQLDANMARAASPLFTLRSIWPFNRLFPNRPLV